MKNKNTPKPTYQYQAHHSRAPLVGVGIILVALILGITLIKLQNTWYLDSCRAALSEISNTDSGATLNEVIINLSHSDVETMVIFDSDGRKLIDGTNDSPHSVGYPRTVYPLLQEFDGLTHIHCHPLSDTGHSDNDLWYPGHFGLESKIDRQIVVTARHVFTMSKASNQSWPSFTELQDFFVPVYQADRSEGLMDSIIVDGVEQDYFTNKCLEMYAERFGYTFTVKDIAIYAS